MDFIHGHATMWPIPLGMAATWDADLLEASASLIAEQATSVGVRWAFAPMVDISRDPRWGRIAESFGEDPYLSGLLGSAIVCGYQGREIEDLKNPTKMAACLKHYVGYGGAEGGRDYNTTEWGENTLRNNHLVPFREGIKAGAQTVMSGFHEISGEPMSSNRHLLTDVLKGEFGFDGFVVSDCYSVQELVNHRRAANNSRAAELLLHAGIDMDMCSKVYLEELPGVLEKNPGILHEIDAAVLRILLVKFRLGLFETPYTDEKSIISGRSREKYEKSSLEVARKSAILLKNKDNILPLPIKEKKIAIVGPMIDERRSLLGTWSSDGDLNDVKTIGEHFRTLGGDFVFAANMEDVGPAVQQADLSILFVGEQKSRTGEGSVVTDITLPHGQDDLIWECAQYGKPLIVVVLTGRPVVLDVAEKVADAVLLQFHAGTMTAQALADLLFGVAEPLGRLPATMPHVSGQIPIHYNFKSTGRPLDKGWWSGSYKHSVKMPLYPFGYGLGYSTFSVSKCDDTESRNSADNETGKKKAGPRCLITLARSESLPSRGDRFRHTFAYTWHFPNLYGRPLKSNPFPSGHDRLDGHYYARNFDSAEAVARYALTDYARLLGETEAFHRAFFDSSLPGFVLDQVNSQLNTFRTSAWLTRTGMYGINEGITHNNHFAGIATTGVVIHSITCNSFVAPERETSVKRLDIPAQFVFQSLRAALWNGDHDWLKAVWPDTKAALAYVLRERDKNGDHLPDMEGVMCSYDNFPMFGVAPFVVTQWLAAVAVALNVAPQAWR